jgi:hypothetical protein
MRDPASDVRRICLVGTQVNKGRAELLGSGPSVTLVFVH